MHKVNDSFNKLLPIRGIVGTIIMLLIFLISVDVVDSLWQRYQIYRIRERPTSYYFEYLGDINERVVPTKLQFALGENPQFLSNTIYHEDVLMTWKDTMFCRPFGQSVRFTRWATQPWSNIAEAKTTDDASVPWAWNQPLPRGHQECYVYGIPYATIRGVQKYTEPYKTVPFEVNVPLSP